MGRIILFELQIRQKGSNGHKKTLFLKGTNFEEQRLLKSCELYLLIFAVAKMLYVLSFDNLIAVFYGGF